MVSTAPARSKQDRGAHHEISVRYAWHARQRKYPRGSAELKRSIRLRDIEWLLLYRYGDDIPCTADTWDVLVIVAHHIAHGSGNVAGHIRAWARLWLSAAPGEKVETLIAEIAAMDKPLKWRAEKLGQQLQLTDRERALLRITTIRAIDVSAEEMTRRRKRKRRMCSDNWRKRKQAERPAKLEPLYKSKPWRHFGISQRTWYRRGKPMPPQLAETSGKVHAMQQGSDRRKELTLPSKNPCPIVRVPAASHEFCHDMPVPEAMPCWPLAEGRPVAILPLLSAAELEWLQCPELEEW